MSRCRPPRPIFLCNYISLLLPYVPSYTKTMTSTRFCFTLNNYTQEHLDALALVECKYLCYGKELAPTTGTPHLQGYVVFSSVKRPTGVAKLIPGAHITIAKGNTQQNITYCSKESELVEFGQRPKTPKEIGESERQRWALIIEHAKADTLESHDPKVYFLHHATAQRLAAQYAKPEALKKIVKVFYGATGTGKTKLAWSEAGEAAYPKDPRSKFWYGYSGQENVIIDEFRGGIDISHILRWLDEYPTIVEVKNSSRVLKVTSVWITSNLHPRLWYPDLDPDTLSALLRRLQVTHFPAPLDPGWVTNAY